MWWDLPKVYCDYINTHELKRKEDKDADDCVAFNYFWEAKDAEGQRYKSEYILDLKNQIIMNRETNYVRRVRRVTIDAVYAGLQIPSNEHIERKSW